MNTLASTITNTPLMSVDLSVEIAEASYVISQIDSIDNRLSSISIPSQPTEEQQIQALKDIVNAFSKNH